MNLADATITQLLIPVDDLSEGGVLPGCPRHPASLTAPPQMAFFQCGAIRLLVGVTPAGQKAQRG